MGRAGEAEGNSAGWAVTLKHGLRLLREQSPGRAPPEGCQARGREQDGAAGVLQAVSWPLPAPSLRALSLFPGSEVETPVPPFQGRHEDPVSRAQSRNGSPRLTHQEPLDQGEGGHTDQDGREAF